jgi:hypothetical protein
MSTQWEYQYVTMGANRQDDLLVELNVLGSLGWEVVGFTSADPTMGVHSYTAILKRQAQGYAAPADVAAGWKPDPASRAELRYWDGIRWSQHVSTAGTPSIDAPNVRS